MKKLYILLILICCCPLAKSQVIIKLFEDTAYLASLENTYRSADNDSAKAYTSFKLSHAYKRIRNLEQSRKHLDNGLSLSENDPFLHAAYYYYRGYLNLGISDLDSIRADFATADSLLQAFKIPEAYKLRSGAWIALGVIQQMRGNEEKAMDAYLNHVLPLAKQSEDGLSIANANKFVGISLLNSKERVKATDYLTDALELFEASPAESKAVRLEAIVEVTIILAENYVYLNKPDLAKEHLAKAIDILKHYPQSSAFLLYYHAEGLYLDKIGRYEEAIKSFDKGIDAQGGFSENHHINRMKVMKFVTLRKLKRNKEAIQVMLDIVKNPSPIATDKSVNYQLLSEAYADEGNMKEAYHWLQLHDEFSDSLNIAKYRSEIVEMEKKYHSAEKEKEIALLQANNQKAQSTKENQLLLNWLLGVSATVLLLTLLIVYSVYDNNKRKHAHRLKELQQQKELEITQAILEGEERERQRIARDLHDGLGGALSGIKIKLSGEQKNMKTPVIDETIMQLENSIGELRRIARNMMPETLIRSGLEVALRDLCVSLSFEETIIEFQPNGIQKDIPVQSQVNIYRIIQELLSNAIRHGHAGKIIVQCIQQAQNFLITVEDDGGGYNVSKKTKSKGIGLTNIRNRVELMEGKIQIDSAINEGTTVNIELHV